jgi:NDP-sugar pyrophosphorylase family protein
VETSGISVIGIAEKPVQRHLINAGIYILDPAVCRLVPEGRPYDMPELIALLVAENRRVVTFLIREYWQDIGRIEDYEKAMAHARDKAT